MSISENIREIRSRIAAAAIKSGRKEEDILLLAVSKTVEAERIRLAMQAGLTTLGENRVQEMMGKYELLPDAKWHLIGTLQKNKVKYIIDKTELVHSLCTMSVANEMQRLCEKQDTYIDVLVEVNVTGEESKSGVSEAELAAFLKDIAELDRVRVKGLMTIAMYSPLPEETRPCFKRLKQIFDELSHIKRDNFEMKYLSMGMSGDYEVAIEEGANIVRIGSAIFGERNYN